MSPDRVTLGATKSHKTPISTWFCLKVIVFHFCCGYPVISIYLCIYLSIHLFWSVTDLEWSTTVRAVSVEKHFFVFSGDWCRHLMGPGRHSRTPVTRLLQGSFSGVLPQRLSSLALTELPTPTSAPALSDLHSQRASDNLNSHKK